MHGDAGGRGGLAVEVASGSEVVECGLESQLIVCAKVMLIKNRSVKFNRTEYGRVSWGD